jgi:hypothetical protein
VILLVLLRTGCGIKTTNARRDHVYMAFEDCRMKAGAYSAQLEYVRTDGGFRYTAFSGSGFTREAECMRAQGFTFAGDR